MKFTNLFNDIIFKMFDLLLVSYVLLLLLDYLFVNIIFLNTIYILVPLIILGVISYLIKNTSQTHLINDNTTNKLLMGVFSILSIITLFSYYRINELSLYPIFILFGVLTFFLSQGLLIENEVL